MRTLLGFLILLLASAPIIYTISNTIKTTELVDSSNVWHYLHDYHLGNDPYQNLQPTGLKFIYPPGSLLVLLPIKLLSLKSFELGLAILSLVFLLTTVIAIAKKYLPASHVFILTAFLIQTYPTKFTLILGQINLVVLCLTCLCFYFYRRSFLLSVLFFSLAATLKVIPLYLLPVFFFYKDFKFITYTLLVFVFLNILPGIQLLYRYLFHVLPSFSHLTSHLPPIYDVSLVALIRRLTHDPSTAKIVLITFLVSFLAMACLYVVRSSNLLAANSLVLAIMSIGNFFSWHHHLVFAFPLLIILYLSHRRAIFLLIWPLLLLHFNPDLDYPLLHPLIASYPTLLILTLLIYFVYTGFTKSFYQSQLTRRI